MEVCMAISSASSAAPQINHPYVEHDPDISGGSAIIVGTRMRVTQIAIEYERLGWTPDQIIDAHPHLTLPQVHDALSYYYENQRTLDGEIAADEAFVEQLRQQYAPLGS
jgi:uncharacterized protein (DUF433 family)